MFNSASTSCFAALLLVSTLFSGCQTVTTRQAKTLDFSKEYSRGMTYFLPRKLVHLKVSAEKLDLAKAKKAVKDATSKQKTAQGEVNRLQKLLKFEQGRLDGMTLGTTAYDNTRAKIDTATVDLANATKALGEANDALLAARTTLLQARANPNGCKYTIAHKLTDPLPDLSRKYVAKPFHNPLRDDTQTLKVSTSGLLTSANVIAEDRTADIIAEFAGVAFGGLNPGVQARALGRMSTPKLPKVKCPTYPGEYIFDPIKGTSTIDAKLLADNYPIKVGVDRLGGVNSTPHPTLQPDGRLSPDLEDALFYRTSTPVVLTFEVKIADEVSIIKDGKKVITSPEDWTPISSSIAMLPQAGPTGHIPMRASAFVKTVSDVTFENGIVTSWHSEKPSEVLEIVRLPVKVASSIISVPASLLSLKVDYSSKLESYASNQALLISQQTRTQNLLNCISAAGDDNAAAVACLPAPE